MIAGAERRQHIGGHIAGEGIPDIPVVGAGVHAGGNGDAARLHTAGQRRRRGVLAAHTGGGQLAPRHIHIRIQRVSNVAVVSRRCPHQHRFQIVDVGFAKIDRVTIFGAVQFGGMRPGRDIVRCAPYITLTLYGAYIHLVGGQRFFVVQGKVNVVAGVGGGGFRHKMQRVGTADIQCRQVIIRGAQIVHRVPLVRSAYAGVVQRQRGDQMILRHRAFVYFQIGCPLRHIAHRDTFQMREIYAVVRQLDAGFGIGDSAYIAVFRVFLMRPVLNPDEEESEASSASLKE